MPNYSIRKPWTIVYLSVVLSLLFLVACGSSSAPVAPAAPAAPAATGGIAEPTTGRRRIDHRTIHRRG